MAEIVADTSALVSLGTATDHDPDPLELCCSEFSVVVSETVLDELEEVASYDDHHGHAADAVLSRTNDFSVRAIALDESFPLDAGENAAVTLANEIDAGLLLCDEFERVGLIHASLADTRLLTTPTLLSVLSRREELAPATARELLDTIATARSWDSNAYVDRARTLLDGK